MVILTTLKGGLKNEKVVGCGVDWVGDVWRGPSGGIEFG